MHSYRPPGGASRALARRCLSVAVWAGLAGAGADVRADVRAEAPADVQAPTGAPTGERRAVPQTASTDATARILAAERLGRAQPAEAARQLDALLPSTPAFSAERLELLTVNGLTSAIAGAEGAGERSAAQLEAWGNHPSAARAPHAAAAALLIRARAVQQGGNLQRADALAGDALARLPADAPARERYRFVFALGNIKEESGKLEDAVRLNHEALALADADGQAWCRSEARSSLAYNYFGAAQFERSRALALEGVAIAEQALEWVALGRAQNSLSIVLSAMGDRQGGRRARELALEAARRAGARSDEVRYLANLSDFFLKTGDFKTARAQAERALVLARELRDINSETIALTNLGLAHIGLQRIELGKRVVNEAIAIEERRGSMIGVSETAGELGLSLERAGDLRGAVAAYHRHRATDTRLQDRDQQKAILAIEAQYEADRRSRALALLEREGEIKAEQLRRRDLQQWLWWLLAGVLGLSSGVVALLYRRVRRANRQLARSNERLRLQSERDPLTGLSNRRFFQDAMGRLAADAKLDGTVYLLDIDHFKRINDRHGHAAGDAVLVEVAARLRATLRDDDLIVRWGGEEFLVVVPAVAPDGGDALAGRLLAALGDTAFSIGAQRITVTASIGFASFPIGPARLRVAWEAAVELVDNAMYLAKTHGRDRACGVRTLQARDAAALAEITHALEAAWRSGRAELTLLHGGSERAAA